MFLAIKPFTNRIIINLETQKLQPSQNQKTRDETTHKVTIIVHVA